MSKEVRKLKFNPKILDEEIVRDSLEAVSQLEEKESIYLIGGVASQSYLPTSCRRPTSDIDYAIVRPLSYPDFRSMIVPVSEFLHDIGYSTETKKGSRASCLYVSDNKTHEGLMVEFPRRNSDNFKKRENMFEREYNNSIKKILEGRDSSYTIASPEDIVVPKLVRSINSLNRNASLERLLPERLEGFDNDEVVRVLSRIARLREEAMISPGDVELAENLRFVSDLYDVRILAEIVGYNEEYLKKVESEWRDIDKNPDLRDKIFHVTFPIK